MKAFMLIICNLLTFITICNKLFFIFDSAENMAQLA